MTTFTTLTNTALSAGKAITQAMTRAFRDNPLAITEMDSTAIAASAFMANAWRAVGGPTEGSALWDFTRDGATATVESPTFEDGYEYAFILAPGVTLSTSAVTINFSLYRATTAAYDSNIAVATGGGASTRLEGGIGLAFPRLSRRTHFASNGWGLIEGGSGATISNFTSQTFSVAQKVGKMRLQTSVGTFNGGAIYCLRRGEYVTR